MKVCEMIERLKTMAQLAEVQIHVNIDTKGIKFEATQPLQHIWMGNTDKYYDADKSCLLIIKTEKEES